MKLIIGEMVFEGTLGEVIQVASYFQKTSDIKCSANPASSEHIKVEHYCDKEDTNFTGSVIDDYGHIAYYLDGQYHRENEPAIEKANGDKEWWSHNEYHRIDGPAREWANGDKFWYLHDKLHRVDGPAVTRISGYKAWYYNDKLISNDPGYTLKDFQRDLKSKDWYRHETNYW